MPRSSPSKPGPFDAHCTGGPQAGVLDPARKRLVLVSTRGRVARAIVIMMAGALVGGFGYSYFSKRVLPIPQRPLRIGFESNPPFQIHTDTGFSGLEIEVVNAAAKRARIQLVWVETGTSSYEALDKGLV